MSTPILEAEDLVKNYRVRTPSGQGRLTAVNNVSLRVDAGTTYGIVGESGCGKSTTAKLLLNLERPSSGTVRFEGKDLSLLNKKEMRELRRDLQVVFQDPFASLNGRMTIGELITEPLRVHGLSSRATLEQDAEELLELVGLPLTVRDRYPRQLSGGQRQRVAIARAIALRPKVIICDEPVSALDVSVQAQIINLLVTLQRELGLTYVFISHDLALVRHLCTRTAVMYLGDVVEEGPTDAVFSDPRHPYTQMLLSAAPIPVPHSDRPARVKANGEVPSPLNRPEGCPFNPRCPLAQEICRTTVPALRETAGGNRAACHFAEGADVRTGTIAHV
ncbi:MAG TPA: ABC transporter ATP-binding protein [Gryllotalpicola sp.]